MTDRAERVTHQARPAIRRHESGARSAAQHRSADAGRVQLAESTRTKPIRRSVDLSPACHAKLNEWCAKTAEEIGAKRVTGQDVMRALVDRLLVDQSLARRIRADLSINT
ncbi:MAG TPA: hypothetical protein VGI84_08760 [Pseudonocardiaceae bacterium]|jgi:hypothetical protein